jgi:hypothetical protein
LLLSILVEELQLQVVQAIRLTNLQVSRFEVTQSHQQKLFFHQ